MLLKRLLQRVKPKRFDRALSLAFCSLVLVLMIAVMVTSVFYFKQATTKSEEQLATMVSVLMRDAVDRISFSGKYHTRLLVEDVSKQLPGINFIRVTDMGGNIVAHSNSRFTGTKVATDTNSILLPLIDGSEERIIRNTQTKNGYEMEISLPFYSGYKQKISGVVSIGFSTENREAVMRDGVVVISSLVTILMIFSTMVIVWLSKQFADPVKHAELQKALAEQKVVAANAESRAKSHFLAIMSHEIRTPMNGVLGMTELLKDTSLDRTQQHYIDVVHDSGQTLLSIINDVLDFSKIAEKKLNIESVVVELLPLIDSCIEIFALRSIDQDLPFIVDIDPLLPLSIHSDPVRLRQVITNLMGNAFKFTKEGEIKLAIKQLDHDAVSGSEAGYPKIRIEIQDSGIGISQEQQKKLFSAFTQADSSTSRQYGGTGLGLAICKQLLELMKGEIGVISEPGKGATFWFDIPLIKSEEKAKIFGEPVFNHRILLLDSDRSFTQSLVPALSSWGFQVDKIGSIDACKKWISGLPPDKQYDLLMINACLSDGSGLSMLEWIRNHYGIKDPGNTAPSVIILSNQRFTPEGPLGNATRELGVDRVLEKPFSYSALNCILSELVLSEIEKSVLTNKVETKTYANYEDLNVLVAEDNSVNSMVVKGLLSKFSIVPLFVINGTEAVDMICETPLHFDLVLMDCEMPVMDGYEATRRVREHEKKQGSDRGLIVGLSAHASEQDKAVALNSGMDDYLTKPISTGVLAVMLEQYFHQNKREENR